jgi:8-oxo-dGTP diphosphatase
MDTIKVVCGIIYKDNKVLICRRKPELFLGGLWEFPGGKVEKGEDDETTLSRELMEELGMIVDVYEYFDTSIYNYGEFTIELIAYKCKFIEAKYNLLDHDIIEWVNYRDLINWKFAPADISIVNHLCNA